MSYETLYTGSSENPEERLQSKHNKGKVSYTKGRMPWKIVYKEAYKTRGEAVKRERFLKSGQGRVLLKKILKDK